METNPYEYEQSVPWTPQQNHIFANKDAMAPSGQRPSQLQNPSSQQKAGVQPPQNRAASAKSARSGGKPAREQRMTKARALDLARTCKKWLVVATIVGFGSVSGLVAYHQAGTTTTVSQTSSAASQSPSSSSSSASNSNSSSNSSNSSNSSTSSSNGYFNQQGSNNFGSGSSSQSSVSGSSVS